MEALHIKEIPISKEDIIGRITLKDIVDPVTGEVMHEDNEMITEGTFNKMLIDRIDSLGLLFIDNVHYLSSLRDTLLTDKVNVQDEALVQIIQKTQARGQAHLSTQKKELF